QYLVGEIEGRERLVADGDAAGAPTHARAEPVDLVGGERLLARAVARGETRGDDDGIGERISEEGCRHGGAEVTVGVASLAVNHDQRAGDLGVPLIERIGAVDE